jgi:hypothetical protein
VALSKALSSDLPVVQRANAMATLFRQSGSRWDEQLRRIQRRLLAWLRQQHQGEGSNFGEEENEEAEEQDITRVTARYRGQLAGELRPIKFVVTRWNSIFDMFMRCLALKQALLIYEAEQGESVLLTREDWVQMEDMVDILGPITEFVVHVQDNKRPTLHEVLPYLLKLITKLVWTPVANAARFSGRTVAEYRELTGQTLEECPDSRMMTPLQR